MRKMYDNEGNVVGTSKGAQGGIANTFRAVFWLIVFVFVIAGIITSLTGG
jgi:hypothetical protein